VVAPNEIVRFRSAPASRNQKISFPFALKKWGAKKENEKRKEIFCFGSALKIFVIDDFIMDF
jgi:hypothetical protein|tara:strand:+ start:1704 stop:1889 length:186 start_codon:yes stop_codon:yes gene_type:complete